MLDASVGSKETKFPAIANFEYETLPSDSLAQTEFEWLCVGKVLLGTPEIRKSLKDDLGWEGQTPELSTHDGDRTVVIHLICHRKDRKAGETQRHRDTETQRTQRTQKGAERSRKEQKGAERSRRCLRVYRSHLSPDGGHTLRRLL